MKIRTFILSITLLAATCPSVEAQGIRKLTRKQAIEENMTLKYSLDSLRKVIHDMENSQDSIANEMIEVYEENRLKIRPEDYTAEVTDSLLSIWYMHRQIQDSQEGEGYDLDSVRFTTDVPDAVLIERLEKMNSFIELPFNETVKNYMILYSEKMPTKMGKILGLGTYYLPIFEEVFAKYKMPLELKYLAIIESAFNPTARSRAGAIGLWQFMYRTAKMYGMRINSFVDERMDVEKSTDAAARYLMDAYELFGDWPLAISSYNCGAGNVNKAIRRAGGKRDFWSIYPYLPRETRGYVPALVGAMYAATYYREYGLVPEAIQLPPMTDTLQIKHNLHFKQIEEVIGLSSELLHDLNPQYTHNIIPGNEDSFILTVPYSFSATFIENQDSIYAHKSSELLSDKVVKNISTGSASVGDGQSIRYKVRSGDYLGRIASKYHVTVAQIKSWNNLRSNNIRVGQYLTIYTRGKVTSSASSGSSTAAPATTTDSEGYTVYTVRQGDSLYSIAKKFSGVSAQNIMDLNKIGSSIRPGMKLRIPKH